MDGRILAPLATAVGAVGIALLFAAMAWPERNHPNPELDGKLALYDRYRAIVRFESRLPFYADGQDQNGSPELFMTGGTPAELSAKLTSLLNQIAQNHGVQVLRTSELTAREKQAIVLIGSEFEVVGQIGAIYAVLKNIDESRPFLVVDRFAVRSNSTYQSSGAEEPPVSATLSVYAAIRRSQDQTIQAAPP